MSLPQDYKPSSLQSRYLKFKEAGTYKFRVLSDFGQGYEAWKDKTPVRAVSLNGLPDESWETQPKHFLVCVIWDRNAELKMKDDPTINPIKILEITQGSIKKAIFDYEHNDDWGDSKGYDLTVTKTGEGLESRYSTVASPHKKLTQEIIDAYKAEKINLGALFTNEDPFNTEPREDISNDEMNELVDEII